LGTPPREPGNLKVGVRNPSWVSGGNSTDAFDGLNYDYRNDIETHELMASEEMPHVA
jgi:hypothetical protein